MLLETEGIRIAWELLDELEKYSFSKIIKSLLS